MNILITGGNGFIAQELNQYFVDKGYRVFLLGRDSLDICDSNKVDNFFKNNQVDFVIHTAVKGGKRGHVESVQDLFDNLIMFDNLSKHSDKFKLMINFGSGAEFDRSMLISLASERAILNRFPKDYYGLSKNMITRKCLLSENIYNLRLFGCFGKLEDSQRFIKTVYRNLINNEDITIHQNNRMDFFYVQDVARVVEYYFKNYSLTLIRDVNLCYPEKQTLLEIVYLIKRLSGNEKCVTIDILNNNRMRCKSYTGNYKNLQTYNIDLIGLEKGIKECLKSWSKS